jgi:hypothetical protein
VGMQPPQALDIRSDKVNQRAIKIEQNSLEHEFYTRWLNDEAP